MILDRENLFSANQAVTATALAQNVVDLGRGDHGPSGAISLVVIADGYTAGTITVELQTADAVGTDGALTNAATVATYPVTADALKAGGAVVAAQLPHGMKRYAGLNYQATGATGGTITAGLALEIPKPMPSTGLTGAA